MTTAHNEEGGARVRVPPPLVFLGFLGVGLALQAWVRPLHASLGRAAHWTGGALLLLAALAIGGAAWRLFKRSGQDAAPWKPSPSLVLRGSYRFTRNPMYLGMTLIQVAVGWAL